VPHNAATYLEFVIRDCRVSGEGSCYKWLQAFIAQDNVDLLAWQLFERAGTTY
jgi:hypothetical protein